MFTVQLEYFRLFLQSSISKVKLNHLKRFYLQLGELESKLNQMLIKILRSFVNKIKVHYFLGGNSQNFFGKFERFFVTLRCFYGVDIHRK